MKRAIGLVPWLPLARALVAIGKARSQSVFSTLASEP